MAGSARELADAIGQHQEALLEQRVQHSSSQLLREEQDAAYERSLMADAQKEAERAEAEERARREGEAEERAQARLQAAAAERARVLQQIQARIPPEPVEGGAAESFKLSLQLPSGQRVQRRFRPADPVSVLYDWAFALLGDDLALSPEDLAIRTMLPPQHFACCAQTSLEDAGIKTLMKLIVELRETYN